MASSRNSASGFNFVLDGEHAGRAECCRGNNTVRISTRRSTRSTIRGCGCCTAFPVLLSVSGRPACFVDLCNSDGAIGNCTLIGLSSGAVMNANLLSRVGDSTGTLGTTIRGCIRTVGSGNGVSDSIGISSCLMDSGTSNNRSRAARRNNGRRDTSATRGKGVANGIRSIGADMGSNGACCCLRVSNGCCCVTTGSYVSILLVSTNSAMAIAPKRRDGNMFITTDGIREWLGGAQFWVCWRRELCTFTLFLYLFTRPGTDGQRGHITFSFLGVFFRSTFFGGCTWGPGGGVFLRLFLGGVTF